MKFIHCSDIHLNFCTYDQPLGGRRRKEFLHGINSKISQGAEFILLTGDITESPFLTSELFWLAENLKRPLYYVLGNHDYWHSSYETAEFYAHSANYKNIIYLPSAKPLHLKDDTWLTGINGRYDCRNYKYNIISDFLHGMDAMNDFDYIENLRTLYGTTEEKLQQVQDLATKEILSLEAKLKEILSHNPKKIIIGTHIPPLLFPNCKIKGNHPGFYSCVSLMNFLTEFACDHQEIEILVFCGHTHGGGSFESNNLKIFGKEAHYGQPDSKMIEI